MCRPGGCGGFGPCPGGCRSGGSGGGERKDGDATERKPGAAG